MRGKLRWYILLFIAVALTALALFWYSGVHAQDCGMVRTETGVFDVCYSTFTPTPEAATGTPTEGPTWTDTPTLSISTATATITPSPSPATPSPPTMTMTPTPITAAVPGVIDDRADGCGCGWGWMGC